jgi:PKD repeat protein
VLLGLAVPLAKPVLADVTPNINPAAAGDQNPLSLFGIFSTNWRACSTSDDGLSFVYTNNSNYLTDLYNLPDQSLTGTINSVTVYIEAERAILLVSPQSSARPAIKTHGGIYYGTEVTLTTSYATYFYTWSTNPNTSTAWSWTEINDLQAGVSLRSCNPYLARQSRCTHVYVVVDYTPCTPPTADFYADDQEVCEGDTVTFTDASSGDMDTWSWDFGDGGTSSDQNPTHQYASAGTYTVFLTVSGVCGDNTKTIDDYITVNELPDCTIDAPDAVCENSTGNPASAPDISGADYSWSIDNGSIDGSTDTRIISWSPDLDSTNTVTLYVTVTDTTTGCSSDCQQDVTVVKACAATAPDFSICHGTTVDNNLFINHGAACSGDCNTTITYNFNSDSPPGNYPYSVTCSNDICEEGAANNANCRRVVVSDNNTMVTKGNGAMPHNAFFAWEPGPNYPNDGPDDSSWAANSLWDQNINYNFSSLGADWIWESYRVVNNEAGDVVYFQRNFNIPGTPTGATLHITCDNGYEAYINGNFIGSAQLGAGWETSDLTQPYVDTTNWQSVEPWTITADKLVSGTNVLLVKAANEQLTGGTISSNPGGLIFELVYEFTDACCCSDNATGTVTINALPNCSISADDAVCAYSDNHTASVENAGQGATYDWNVTGNGTLTIGNGTNSITWDAGAAGTANVSINITNADGCSCSDNVDVTVNPLPNCIITADDAVCAYSDNNTTSVPDAGANANYDWTITDNCTITSDQPYDNIITWDAGAAGTATISINITNANGCSCSDNVDVTINPLPVATASSNSPLCIGSTLKLTGGPDGMTSYSWTGPNGYTSDNQSPSVPHANAAMSGTYTLTVTNSNGCTSDNATVSVSVVTCGGGGGGGLGGIPSAALAAMSTATANACPLTLTVNMLGQITTATMSSDGILCENCLAFDPQKQNSWEAKEGTKLTLEGDKVPQLIKITTVGSSPSAGNAKTIGPTYEINAYASITDMVPAPIAISPLFTMTSAYDPGGLPENISEVLLSYYPNRDQGWQPMGSEGVVAAIGEAQGTLSYFPPETFLTKLAKTGAKFEVSNLNISPAQIQPAQQATISVNVANTGGTSGDYIVELKINGVVESTKQITLDAGASQIESFTVARDVVGKYQIDIAGLKGELVVSTPSKINWWFIGGLIAALILALAIWILMRWRRFSGY